MFSSLTGWVIILIVIAVILIIGGIALPIIVPMMTGYTSASEEVIDTGTPFFQLLAHWWPLVIPIMLVFAVVMLIMSRGRSGGGGGV